MIAPAEAASLSRSLTKWYGRVRRDLPWRRTRDPYRVWVSEVMLQQTTVRAVVPYYERFLARFPTVEALAAARPARVLASWSGLGYYRRARHMHAAARAIVRRHGGRFPDDFSAALALPGIGRYTAGAVLSIAYGRPLPIVDGNVARVLSRLRLIRGRTQAARDAALWRAAESLAGAAESPGDLNQALMELGATVCLPRRPDCAACPVARHCRARAAGAAHRIPPLRAPTRKPVTIRQSVAVVAQDGRYLMRRRRDPVLMEGLWEFPVVDREKRNGAAPRLRLFRAVGTIRHSITYRRLELQVRPASLLGATPPRYRWLTRREIAGLPTSSIVSKVLSLVERTQARSSVKARKP